jgi:beta-glucanase (GH16 family)
MRVFSVRPHALLVILAIAIPPLVMGGCGSGATVAFNPVTGAPASNAPSITAAAAQGGAEVVTIASNLSGASVFYTLDGSVPTIDSVQYLTPFLLTQTTTVNAVAINAATQSSIATQAYNLNIPSGTLVWSDEFTNETSVNAQPNPAIWTYDSGASGYGNQELEDYCAWASNLPPCASSNPNVYVGTDGFLHIVAEQPSPGVYTSARIRTQGLFSMSYGRVEARMFLPEGQGFWPAFWLMGNNFATVGWPICGEQDVMEHTNAPSPDYVLGSVHMPNANYSHQYLSSGYSAAAWHTYGMIWTKGSVAYYVDSPTNIYATYTAANVTASGGTWPFDSGNSNFLILNLSVGGLLPGSPNSSTPFPSQLLVDYVRLYTN